VLLPHCLPNHVGLRESQPVRQLLKHCALFLAHAEVQRESPWFFGHAVNVTSFTLLVKLDARRQQADPRSVAPKSTPEDPDAGMLDAKPEFNLEDYSSEEEMLAALRARLGDVAFDRLMDQANGDGIVVKAPVLWRDLTPKEKREALRNEHLAETFPDDDGGEPPPELAARERAQDRITGQPSGATFLKPGEKPNPDAKILAEIARLRALEDQSKSDDDIPLEVRQAYEARPEALAKLSLREFLHFDRMESEAEGIR
jgi:hypothetical protein